LQNGGEMFERMLRPINRTAGHGFIVSVLLSQRLQLVDTVGGERLSGMSAHR
jgi:hypothetical protein